MADIEYPHYIRVYLIDKVVTWRIMERAFEYQREGDDMRFGTEDLNEYIFELLEKGTRFELGWNDGGKHATDARGQN